MMQSDATIDDVARIAADGFELVGCAARLAASLIDEPTFEAELTEALIRVILKDTSAPRDLVERTAPQMAADFLVAARATRALEAH